MPTNLVSIGCPREGRLLAGSVPSPFLVEQPPPAASFRGEILAKSSAGSSCCDPSVLSAFRHVDLHSGTPNSTPPARCIQTSGFVRPRTLLEDVAFQNISVTARLLRGGGHKEDPRGSVGHDGGRGQLSTVQGLTPRPIPPGAPSSPHPDGAGDQLSSGMLPTIGNRTRPASVEILSGRSSLRTDLQSANQSTRALSRSPPIPPCLSSPFPALHHNTHPPWRRSLRSSTTA